MQEHTRAFKLIKYIFVFFLLVGGLIGCAEQPSGYIYRPTESDEVTLARATTEIISSIFDHLDMATRFLEDASRTDRWDTILPPGWIEIYDIADSERDTVSIEDIGSVEADAVDVLDTIFVVDGTDTLDILLAINKLDLDTLYLHNYLDQKYEILEIDKDPLEGAVRTPSNLDYRFIELRNFFNQRTSEFYVDIYESSHLIIEYADGENPGDRKDPQNVNGWLDITRAVPFEETIDLGDFEYDYTYYQYPTWVMNIKDFTIDPYDHSAKIRIEGTFPHVDEAENYRKDHVSGEINIYSNGKGTGVMSLFGEPIALLHFIGRGAGFTGYFTMHKQDHERKHDF